MEDDIQSTLYILLNENLIIRNKIHFRRCTIYAKFQDRILYITLYSMYSDDYLLIFQVFFALHSI